ncbi:dihydrodipicolinate synthase family protein [Roseibium polysiphoniae]|uniref:Dihydrodipicolinate synthase family protein n=1 Tax=Roseibium polysiphoniae TaxID=2571221 RepID=A0A944CCB0_9HYPH|nr:dihydrodipicolinate synthase family protein [Roseibium polysiphoniae]MBS8259879.1 dihydrodipicolinate synthase family protein [Roseibium polysiphoniae]
MKLGIDAKGVFIISATPFTDTGQIDYASADGLVEFYLERGVTGMTILGMMGEAPKLSDAESLAFMSHMIERVGGRVPVVVGVSNPGITNLASLSHAAMDKGAAGVMVAPMRGLATEERIYSYFAQVFEALGPDVPVCFQDYPLSTGVSISVDLFTRLVLEFDQLVMLKHEDWPGLNKLSAVRKSGQERGARRVSVLCGNGGIFLPEEMTRGADGAMTGFAFPEMLVDVVRLSNAGDSARASDIFDAYLPLVRLEQQPGAGLAIRKEVLRRRGALSNATTRAPGPKLSAEDHKDLDRLLARLDTRLKELGHGS